jgi:Fe-S cluster biogenesis protein NfuA
LPSAKQIFAVIALPAPEIVVNCNLDFLVIFVSLYKMPKISDIQETPNPNAVKFILREPVTRGVARSFKTADDAFEDKLARELFEVGDVASVFYMDYMITVEKSDYAVWDDLLPRLAIPIRAADAVNGNGNGKSPAEAVGGALAAAVSEDPRLAQINELLDARIRPALAGDGGWVDVLSLTDNVLTLRYQGACGTCPSSLTGTLMAIEGMIHDEIDPEIEVIAV